MKFNGRNVFISPRAKIGANVKIGDNTSIYDNVEIGDNSIICNHAEIGEPLVEYYHQPAYENPPTVIGPGALIRSHSIVYAGCTIGANLSTGHHMTIREHSVIGHHCSIGTMCDIQGRVQIGNHCRLHSDVGISQKTILEDFVLIFPFSAVTNDATPPSYDEQGSRIGRFTIVAVHSVILPNIQVGENCFIGANSVVNRPLDDYSFAVGNPARKIMDIRDYVVKGKGNPYPWMKRFERNMPWEGVGFDAWRSQCLAASAAGS